jgi:hypothetical protein
MKNFRTSYSQNNTYIQCPEHWNKSYVEKYKSPVDGASLYFGSAVDYAAEQMLKGEKDWLRDFYDRWNKAYGFGKSTQIYDNDNIVYGYKDFDEYTLEDKDIITVNDWATELGFQAKGTAVCKVYLIKLFKDIMTKKKNPYKGILPRENKYYNRLCWLSMKRKGKLLLQAFERDFLPKVTKVVAVQQRADLKAPNGDTIVGYIDFVLEIEGYDKPIIFDLKTAARPYTQDNIDFSDQLTLYSAMKGKEYDTDLVGYVVLPKQMSKVDVSTCKSCGNVKTGRHKTCDAIQSDGKRCEGEWDVNVTCTADVQVMVANKTQKQMDMLLSDMGNIVLAMKNGVVYKNTSKCTNWYGGICPFFNACHKNDYSDLIKK